MSEYSKQPITKQIENSSDISLPVIETAMSSPTIRSIDEINMFIEHDYALFYNKERHLNEKRKMSVFQVFTLK
jgi:hypothetical protein